MRRFLIENRRRMSQIAVIILAIVLVRFVMNQTAPIEEKIISSNHRIYYNNKNIYLKNINVEGINNASDFRKLYTFIDFEKDNANEILLRYTGNDKNCYFVIRLENKKYVMYGPMYVQGLETMTEDYYIKFDDATIGNIKYENGTFTFEKITYINLADSKEEYIVEGKIQDKTKYNSYLKAFENKPKLKWNNF